MTLARFVRAAYICLVAGLAINQVAGAWSPWVVLLLVVVTLPSGLVAYVAQYQILFGLGVLANAPAEGSPLIAIVFVALWVGTAVLNVRIASSVARWLRARSDVSSAD